MAHDQLFKDLLRAFFREFLELFYPAVAARIDFSTVTFLNTEEFTDLPVGERRQVDLLAQVRTLDGSPEDVQIHVEVEREHRSVFRERIFKYGMVFRLRRTAPLFPIAIYLSGGAGGVTTEQHIEGVFGTDVFVFTYHAVGLPDLNADDYLGLPNPLAPALSALMRTSRLGKVAQKYRSLLAMARSGVDEARLSLLTNMVETYLELSEVEAAEFSALTASPEGEEVRQMVSIYEQRGIEKGIEKGKREILLQLFNDKFGPLPDDIQTRLSAVSSPTVFAQLSREVLFAKSLDEITLPNG